jgi:hypothetical protein
MAMDETRNRYPAFSWCAALAVGLLVLFSAVNLFIPYALLALGALVGLGFACRVVSRARRSECRLGFC